MTERKLTEITDYKVKRNGKAVTIGFYNLLDMLRGGVCFGS